MIREHHEDLLYTCGFSLCISILYLTHGNLLQLAGVYTISFLGVMTLFGIGNILLKINRKELKRTYRAGWSTVILGVLATSVGIIGNVMQSFNGKELYPTAEEKAAHLLYFMVKNHPFIDGNKRSGAFVFVWFLQQANILDVAKLTPSALTALTIMVAESNPEHKEKVVKLILNLISKR